MRLFAFCVKTAGVGLKLKLNSFCRTRNAPNLVPRAFSSFKMAVGEIPGQGCWKTSRIVEHFVTWHSVWQSCLFSAIGNRYSNKTKTFHRVYLNFGATLATLARGFSDHHFEGGGKTQDVCLFTLLNPLSVRTALWTASPMLKFIPKTLANYGHNHRRPKADEFSSESLGTKCWGTEESIACYSLYHCKPTTSEPTVLVIWSKARGLNFRDGGSRTTSCTWEIKTRAIKNIEAEKFTRIHFGNLCYAKTFWNEQHEEQKRDAGMTFKWNI